MIERSGVRLQTITSAQIQNGGYYDVGQALQALVPGLFLTPKAGPFDYVTASLEGSRTNEILWLVDGVRISNRLYNGTTPLDTIRPVTSGAFSASRVSSTTCGSTALPRMTVSFTIDPGAP